MDHKNCENGCLDKGTSSNLDLIIWGSFSRDLNLDVWNDAEFENTTTDFEILLLQNLLEFMKILDIAIFILASNKVLKCKWQWPLHFQDKNYLTLIS